MTLAEKIALACLVASILASILNEIVRARAEGGGATPQWVLTLLSLLNIVAANPFKSLEMAKGYRGPSLPPPPAGTPPVAQS